MSDTIIGALIALGGVIVAGFMQWLQELWRAKQSARQQEQEKKKAWQEELYFARTMKALVNTNFSDDELAHWDGDQTIRQELFDKLAALEWHAARLRGANLNGMLLNRVFMPAADLTEARLDGITLSNAFMPEALFVKASFHAIQKQMVDGQRQEWTASLFHSFFWRADFTEADLTAVDLTETNFCRAELWSAQLVGADLQFAKFTKANLGAANLRNAKVGHTDFTDAYLGEADLRGIRVDEPTLNTLKNAEGLAKAKLDDELKQKIFN